MPFFLVGCRYADHVLIFFLSSPDHYPSIRGDYSIVAARYRAVAAEAWCDGYVADTAPARRLFEMDTEYRLPASSLRPFAAVFSLSSPSLPPSSFLSS